MVFLFVTSVSFCSVITPCHGYWIPHAFRPDYTPLFNNPVTTNTFFEMCPPPSHSFAIGMIQQAVPCLWFCGNSFCLYFSGSEEAVYASCVSFLIDLFFLIQAPTLTMEGGRLKRLLHLMAGRDFETVPEPVWRALYHWYGANLSLPRPVCVLLFSTVNILTPY